MFDLSGNERLTEWRRIRDSLNNSHFPEEEVLEIWKKAPFVSRYLDPSDPDSWPDPWHLILDNRYDDLAIALGIAYTLGLSARFMSVEIEIHMSILNNNEYNFFVVLDQVVIDVTYRTVRKKDYLTSDQKRIWTYQNKS